MTTVNADRANVSCCGTSVTQNAGVVSEYPGDLMGEAVLEGLANDDG